MEPQPPDNSDAAACDEGRFIYMLHVRDRQTGSCRSLLTFGTWLVYNAVMAWKTIWRAPKNDNPIVDE